MAKTKITNEEKLKKQEEKALKIKKFKEENSLDNISDSTILSFMNTLKKDYADMETKEAIELLFKKFANGEFKFELEIIKRYH